MPKQNIVLIGNPNAGKTSLFNLLTGLRQRVGNWSGVTVEKKTGEFEYQGQGYSVVDLPGLYDLSKTASTDEHIARDYILNNSDDLYINVVDASTLDRGLFLTLQLRDMGLKCLVVLNMMDVAHRQGVHVEHELLEENLGCPVVPISLKRPSAGEAILAAIAEHLDKPQMPRLISYGEVIDLQIVKLEKKGLCRREIMFGLAAPEAMGEPYIDITEKLKILGTSLNYRMADFRFEAARRVAQHVVFRRGRASKSLTEKIDILMLGKHSAMLMFLLIMYLLFFFSITVGGAFIDFFDIAAGTIFVDGIKALLNNFGLPEWLQVIIGDGVGGGIQVVATFIPIIAALYFFLTLLEESGYMARAAFVMDRVMRRVGVSGKSFVPLVIGFGCNVPGIMAARTIGQERERILTVLMAPFMSCGARLPVYALFAAAFFASYASVIVFSLYIIGILMAMFTAALFSRAFGKSKPEPLLLELPVYQRPGLRDVLLNTWQKTRGFIVDAGKLIVLAVAVINIVNSIGTDGSFGNENTEQSVLSETAKFITPVFEPMGVTEDNWQATVGIVTGLLAKEVVVGTLDTLYSAAAKASEPESGVEVEYSFLGGLREAWETIPDNLSSVGEGLVDPLGFGGIDDSGDDVQAAETIEVNEGTFRVMRERFHDGVGAYAYLLFILLYIPCVAASGAMIREAGSKWGRLGIIWTGVLAYVVAVMFYQAATFSQHPWSSGAWLVLGVSFFIGVFWWLKREGTKQVSYVERAL